VATAVGFRLPVSRDLAMAAAAGIHMQEVLQIVTAVIISTDNLKVVRVVMVGVAQGEGSLQTSSAIRMVTAVVGAAIRTHRTVGCQGKVVMEAWDRATMSKTATETNCLAERENELSRDHKIPPGAPLAIHITTPMVMLAVIEATEHTVIDNSQRKKRRRRTLRPPNKKSDS